MWSSRSKLANIFQSSSFSPFMSIMKRRSTSVKVTFDPSLLCRRSCRRCFSFRTTFSRVFSFHFCLYFSSPVLPGDTTFLEPFFHLILSDFCGLSTFSLRITLWIFLALAFDLRCFFFWENLLSLCPCGFLFLSTPFPEPTLEAKSSAAFTISLKPSLLSVSTPMLESLCSSLMTFLTTETKRFPAFSSSEFFWTPPLSSSGHRPFSFSSSAAAS